MDYKKTKAPLTTITRNLYDLDGETQNIYQTVKIAAKRANQISVEMKQELNRKLEEFASYTDNLEEVFENPEQIEISRFFERLPKPSLISLQELTEDQIYFRMNEAPKIEDK
jgi:DNA-directed RNA polymerase subunit K/omega